MTGVRVALLSDALEKSQMSLYLHTVCGCSVVIIVFEETDSFPFYFRVWFVVDMIARESRLLQIYVKKKKKKKRKTFECGFNS